MPSKNMKGLTFFGHDDIKLNNTVDTEDQNNSTFNSTIYGLQFEKNTTNLSGVNHAGQNETDGGHQYVILWVLLGLCILFFAWLCFIFRRKIWHKIVKVCPVPKSQVKCHRSSDDTDVLHFKLCLRDRVEIENVKEYE